MEEGATWATAAAAGARGEYGGVGGGGRSQTRAALSRTAAGLLLAPAEAGRAGGLASSVL